MSSRAEELGRFLRARRDRVSPAQAGLTPVGGPRRVPGLRREELAMLAGLSSDYLGRLEQGRQQHVSDGVLDALARALRLDDAERAHLHTLALPARAVRGGDRTPQRADPGLLRLMTALDRLPVLLLGHRGEVLARNRLLESVLTVPFAPGDSFVEFLFEDPVARVRIVDWEVFAAATAAALRGELGRRPFDTKLRALVERLRTRDLQFATWWDDHRVVDYASMSKTIDHPVGGTLRFDIEIVSPPHEPEQRLVVYTAQPGSATERALPLLAGYGPDTTASGTAAERVLRTRPEPFDDEVNDAGIR